jgi:hypothetical protein
MTGGLEALQIVHIVSLIFSCCTSHHSALSSLDASCFLNVAGNCPNGTAWVDVAYATDVAHLSAECSNAGICDRVNGSCVCFEGYTGNACQRSKSNIYVVERGG